MLINDILDLSKIESGTVVVDAGELRLDDLHGYVERTFRHVAESKNVEFLIRFDPRLPKSMFTDAKRLQQIIKNLLSNAFKFTHHGQVTLTVEPVAGGWNPDNEDLNRAAEVLAFAVSDTGIGIPPDKQQIIFEAFQQADGSHQPQVRRHRPGPGHQPRAVAAARRRNPPGVQPGRGQHVHLYLPATYTPPRPAASADRRTTGRRPPPRADQRPRPATGRAERNGRLPRRRARTPEPDEPSPLRQRSTATTATTSSRATACC